jgi:hypothetical protein
MVCPTIFTISSSSSSSRCNLHTFLLVELSFLQWWAVRNIHRTKTLIPELPSTDNISANTTLFSATQYNQISLAEFMYKKDAEIAHIDHQRVYQGHQHK